MANIQLLTPISGTMVCDKAGTIEGDALLIDITLRASAGRKITIIILLITHKWQGYCILAAYFYSAALKLYMGFILHTISAVGSMFSTISSMLL